MRKENGPQNTAQRFKKVYKKGTIFFRATSKRKQKRISNRRPIPMRLSKT